MESNELGLLEELLFTQKGENCWTTYPDGLLNEIVPNFQTLDQDLNSNSSLLGLLSSTESTFAFPYFGPCTFGSIHNEEYDLPSIPSQEDFEGLTLLANGVESWKVEREQVCERADAYEAGEKKSRIKKVGAQPSKNLMAERRRRKRLNDRLSMLRSIVPKISKMERTAILGDTIDYMKELLDKIRKLGEEKMNENDMTFGSSLQQQIMPNESFVRNTPKFDVERRNGETRIELGCGAKPGMLLSTLSTLEALGLDIQQCVISCFNDFSLQASCSEVAEDQGIFSFEDIKQALVRNAGYCGRCL